MMRVATALAGVVLVLVPVAAEPAWAYPVVLAGLLCALVTAWPRHGMAAARRARAALRGGPAAGRRDQAADAGTTASTGTRASTGTTADAGTAVRATGRPGRDAAGRQAASGGQAAGRDAGRGGQALAARNAADGIRGPAGTAAAVAAVAGCAVSRLDTAAMAGEGLLLLVFLLLLGRPAGLAGAAVRTWLRLRVPTVLAAVAVTGIVLAALATVPGASPWLALGGLVAAVVAYVVAPPRSHPDELGPR